MKNNTPSPRKSPAAVKKTAANKTAKPKAKTAVSAKAPARKPARPKKAADPQRELVEQVRAVLDAKKGEDIAVLHVADVSSVTDYMILCTGLNTPHLRALSDEVVKQLRRLDPPRTCHRRAGSVESQWFVLDYIDFVVHLFTPATRAYYAIEKLWKDAPVV